MGLSTSCKLLNQALRCLDWVKSRSSLSEGRLQQVERALWAGKSLMWHLEVKLCLWKLSMSRDGFVSSDELLLTWVMELDRGLGSFPHPHPRCAHFSPPHSWLSNPYISLPMKKGRDMESRKQRRGVHPASDAELMLISFPFQIFLSIVASKMKVRGFSW